MSGLIEKIKDGNYEPLEKYLQKHLESYDACLLYIFTMACCKNYLHVARHIYNNYNLADVHRMDDVPFRFAAKSGSFEVIKWLVEDLDANIYVRNGIGLEQLAKNKQLEILKWLYEYTKFDDKVVLHAADYATELDEYRLMRLRDCKVKRVNFFNI